jgi:hypothetical protein
MQQSPDPEAALAALANLERLVVIGPPGGIEKARSNLATIRAALAAARDLELRYKLDAAGLERREAESVELVELRAAVAAIKAERDEARKALMDIAEAFGWSRQRAWETIGLAQAVKDLRAALAALERERDDLRDALIVSQWGAFRHTATGFVSGGRESRSCPACMGICPEDRHPDWKNYGHHEGCPIRAALERKP